MKLTISCKLWNDLISAWWNKIKPCAHVLFTLDGAIPELRGYWTPVRDFVSITPRIESLFWALSWRGQDFRMFLSVEVLRNLPFVQSRNRPFMLFSYSCIPRDAWKEAHISKRVFQWWISKLCFLRACHRRWWLGSLFTRTSPSFCNGWRRALGFVKKWNEKRLMGREPTWFQPLSSLCGFLFGNKTKDSLYSGEGCLVNS